MIENRVIRVLIADDQGLFRDLMYRVCSQEERLDVVGAVHDGETAVQMSRDLEPDVVIMDIEMPGSMDGIQAALQIKKERPATGILMLTHIWTNAP